MSWRGLMPRRMRARKAAHWLQAAEAAEWLVLINEEAPHARARWAKQAMENYLKALAWGAVESPEQVPLPSDEGGSPAPEDQAATIPCVICATPIAWPKAGHPEGAGLYCQACA